MRSADGLPTLPTLACHAADGRLSSELVDAIVREMNHIDKRSATAISDDERSECETELLGRALSGATPAQVLEHARTIANTLADATDTAIAAADDSSLNTVNVHTADDGRIDIRADLTQVVGEKFLAMIHERSCPRTEPDGTDDRRTAEQTPSNSSLTRQRSVPRLTVSEAHAPNSC